MSKIKSKEQYALDFFKENPKVKTLWANPKGEFFTDINYANNSLEKDENGKIEILEVFTSEAAAETVKEIIDEKAIVPVNPIVPEVFNTLKVVENSDEKNTNPALLVEKATVKGKSIDAKNTATKVVVKKGTQPEVIENGTSSDDLIGKIEVSKGVNSPGEELK